MTNAVSLDKFFFYTVFTTETQRHEGFGECLLHFLRASLPPW